MPQHSSQEKHFQPNVITVISGIPHRLLNFASEFRGKSFICIQQKNPVVSEGQSVHRPLALFRPPAGILKLDDLGSEGARDLTSIILALRVNDVDLSDTLQ